MRAYRIAYDGHPYRGFQRQPDVSTVEDAIFDALRELGVLEAGAEKPPGYSAAGRTDAGVSARCQTIALEAPEWLTPAALNGGLPATTRAWAMADVAADFHATHDAIEREYTYYLPAAGLDSDRVEAALSVLAGRQDFHNLTSDDGRTVRDLSTDLHADSDHLVITLRAGGFPRQLVRRAVSLAAAVGRGERSLDDVETLLGPDSVDGPDGVGPAPPEPLLLSYVTYEGITFVGDGEAIESARTVFSERHRSLAARVRVAATLGRLGDERV